MIFLFFACFKYLSITKSFIVFIVLIGYVYKLVLYVIEHNHIVKYEFKIRKS